MPAFVAIRYSPIVKKLYENLPARKKTKMAAIGAVMRKLRHIIYGVLKNGRSFNPTMAKLNFEKQRGDFKTISSDFLGDFAHGVNQKKEIERIVFRLFDKSIITTLHQF